MVYTFLQKLVNFRSSTITSDDCQQAAICRNIDTDAFGCHDDCTRDPGYVHDNIWSRVNVKPAVETLRRHIGGDGRGDGDPLIFVLLRHAYVASDIDEFRRPLKLRERLKETEGSVTSTESELTQKRRALAHMCIFRPLHFDYALHSLLFFML